MTEQKKRRSFTPEYRAEAARLVISTGRRYRAGGPRVEVSVSRCWAGGEGAASGLGRPPGGTGTPGVTPPGRGQSTPPGGSGKGGHGSDGGSHSPSPDGPANKHGLLLPNTGDNGAALPLILVGLLTVAGGVAVRRMRR